MRKRRALRKAIGTRAPILMESRADHHVAVASIIGTIRSLPNLHPLVTASGLMRGVLGL